jgi:hypothetical protein
VPDITAEEREVLWKCARYFDREPPKPEPNPRQATVDGLRPGDDHDRRGPDWSEILGRTAGAARPR